MERNGKGEREGERERERKCAQLAKTKKGTLKSNWILLTDYQYGMR